MMEDFSILNNSWILIWNYDILLCTAWIILKIRENDEEGIRF